MIKYFLATSEDVIHILLEFCFPTTGYTSNEVYILSEYAINSQKTLGNLGAQHFGFKNSIKCTELGLGIFCDYCLLFRQFYV